MGFVTDAEKGATPYPGLVSITAAGNPIPENSSVLASETFKAYFARAIVPKSGTLKDLSLAIGNVHENGSHTRAAIFDTGTANAGYYTALWEGAEHEYGFAQWESAGAPELAVTAGEQLLVGFMTSNALNQFMYRGKAVLSAYAELHSGHLPVTGGALPKIIGTHKYTELNFGGVGAKLKESELEHTTGPFFLFEGLIE